MAHTFLLRTVAVCAAVAAATSSGCTGPDKIRYTTQVVTAGAMTESISATGEVTARTKVNIGSQVSGTIAEVKVDFNDAVHAGQVLACVAPQVFEAQAARARAGLAVAEADTERAELELRDAKRTQGRHQKLGQGDMLSPAEVDKSDVAVDAAEANKKKALAAVMQAKADLAQAQVSLASAQIRSPVDGVVLDRQVEVGQTVAAQFQVATLFVVVGDMNIVHVVVNIDEADVGDVRAGMPVTFRVDAYPETTFEGVLHSLRRAPVGLTEAASTTSGVVTYAAIIEANNPNQLLMQGMTAQADIQKAHRDAALRLPLAALRFVPKDSASGAIAPSQARGSQSGVVYVLEADKPVPHPVRLGLRDGRFVEVLEGLASGDAVIVGETGGAKAARAGGMGRGRH